MEETSIEDQQLGCPERALPTYETVTEICENIGARLGKNTKTWGCLELDLIWDGVWDIFFILG